MFQNIFAQLLLFLVPLVVCSQTMLRANYQSSETIANKVELQEYFIDTTAVKLNQQADLSALTGIQWQVEDLLGSHGYVTAGDNTIFVAAETCADLNTIRLTSYDQDGNVVRESSLSDEVRTTIKTIAYYDKHVFLAYSKKLGPGKNEMIIAKLDTNLRLIWETNIGNVRISSLRIGDRIKIDGERIIILDKNYDIGLCILNHDGEIIDRVTFEHRDILEAYLLINRAGNIVIAGSYLNFDIPRVGPLGQSFILEFDENYQVANEITLSPKYAVEKAMTIRLNNIKQDPHTGDYFALGVFNETDAKSGSLSYPMKLDFLVKFDESFKNISSLQFLSDGMNITNHLTINSDRLMIASMQKRQADKTQNWLFHEVDLNLNNHRTFALNNSPAVISNLKAFGKDCYIFGGGISSNWLKKLALY